MIAVVAMGMVMHPAGPVVDQVGSDDQYHGRNE